jgi:hypothetical protein
MNRKPCSERHQALQRTKSNKQNIHSNDQQKQQQQQDSLVLSGSISIRRWLV